LIDVNIPKRCCHVFAENKLIDPKQVIGAQSLPRVEMPNHNGFIVHFRKKTPH
jgi:hypothetical protein